LTGSVIATFLSILKKKHCNSSFAESILKLDEGINQVVDIKKLIHGVVLDVKRLAALGLGLELQCAKFMA
jgi:hypothetical protein